MSPFLKFILVLSIFFSSLTNAVDVLQTLKIASRQNPEYLNVKLNQDEKKWLQKKMSIRIGVWGDDTPPFKIFPDSGTYEGITADYTLIVGLNLGVNINLIYYKNRNEAIVALENNKIDLLSDDSSYSPINNETLYSTLEFASSPPVIVTRDNYADSYPKNDKVDKIAVSDYYLMDNYIKKFYPDSSVKRFQSDKSAISSVAFGENNIFIGNMISAGFIIARNYTNSLSIKGTLPGLRSGPRFILRKSDPELTSSVNKILQAIPEDRQRYLLSQWGGFPDPWRFQKPLELNGQEKMWLEKKRVIRVIVNPYFAPYTLLSTAGAFQGISADVLRMIHLRTGIDFVPVISSSVDNMFDLAQSDKGDLLAAMSSSPSRERKLNFTRPYISTPFVLIVRNVSNAPSSLHPHMKIATTRDNIVSETIKEKFSGIDFIIADNASLAMKLVEEGKVDAALHNQLGADYMIERYFKGKLKIASRISEAPAQVSFAIRWDEPELYSIINKALADIEPQDISLLVNKWQSMPDGPINTWNNYSANFYILLFFVALLITSIIIWNYFRNREIERKLTSHNKTKSQLKFLDKIIDASPTPVYFIDNDYRVIKYNKSFSEFFSGETADFPKLTIFDQRHPLYVLLDFIKSAMEYDEIQSCHVIKNKTSIYNGTDNKVISHWTLPYSDEKGVRTGLICGWIDVTYYENNLESLSKQKEMAENASIAKSNYLATISHEIRTQISPILGVLEIEMINYPDSNNLKTAFESSRNLLELLGNVIDIAKIENGKIDLISSWVMLEGAILPVVKVFDTVACQKNNVIIYNERGTKKVEVFLDISRFRQVISNIISNAVKFTQEGKIEIDFTVSYVNQQTACIDIFIRDSGAGITSSDLEQLFKPYSQVGEGKKQAGSGLGLSISRQIIEAMGGKLNIQSVYSMGTSVHIQLNAPSRKAVSYTIGSFLKEYDEKSLLILIVDDHPASRLVLRQQLSFLGHQVIECSHPGEAITALNAADFDAVFTDCSMPEIDGYTFTNLIRKSGNNINIIGLTASAFTSTRLRCLESGMNECLFKPVAIPQLKEVLRSIQLIASALPLSRIIDLDELHAMMHGNDAAIHELLKKVDEENSNDLKFAKDFMARKDWESLSKCIHRISGGAQIIYCSVIDQLCNRIELHCASPTYPEDIEKLIDRLEIKLKVLHRAISNYLEGLG